MEQFCSIFAVLSKFDHLIPYVNESKSLRRVYKFKRNVGKPYLSDQFKKIVKRYIRVGYNLDIMRQSACLALNPITVYSYVWESVIVLCFVVRYFMSILVLQSS